MHLTLYQKFQSNEFEKGSLLLYFGLCLHYVLVNGFQDQSNVRNNSPDLSNFLICKYKTQQKAPINWNFGGERGIRTPGTFGSTVFKTAAFDRSAISPAQK